MNQNGGETIQLKSQRMVPETKRQLTVEERLFSEEVKSTRKRNGGGLKAGWGRFWSRGVGGKYEESEWRRVAGGVEAILEEELGWRRFWSVKP